jgi:hypothetical protein
MKIQSIYIYTRIHVRYGFVESGCRCSSERHVSACSIRVGPSVPVDSSRAVLVRLSSNNNRDLPPQRTTSDLENDTCDLWDASWIMYILA